MKKYVSVSVLVFLSIFATSEAYGQKAKPRTTAKAPASQKGTLNIEAGLVFKNGDVKPVARTDFFLISEPLDSVLSNAGLKKEVKEGGRTRLVNEPAEYFNYDYSLAMWKYGSSLYSDSLAKAIQTLKENATATLTTDFSGKSTLQGVKTGNYFLVGIGGTERQAVVWNMPIQVTVGTTNVVLDNKNASAIF